MSLSEIFGVGERTRMRRFALRVVGLGAAEAERDEYLALIGPGETDATRSAMLTMSGCGLTVRGLWRRFGMVDPRLEPPYEPASVMTTIQGMAKEADAWHAGGSGLPELGVGDVVYVSQPDHVGTIVRVDERDGGVDVTTVDGGSKDAAGLQKIVTFDRSFGLDGSVTAGPMAGQGRQVVGTVSLPAMAKHFGGGTSDADEWLLVGAVGLGVAALARHLLRRR